MHACKFVSGRNGFILMCNIIAKQISCWLVSNSWLPNCIAQRCEVPFSCKTIPEDYYQSPCKVNASAAGFALLVAKNLAYAGREYFSIRKVGGHCKYKSEPLESDS